MPWPLTSATFVVGYSLLAMLSSYLLGVLLAAKLLRYSALTQWQLGGRAVLVLAGIMFVMLFLLAPNRTIFQPVYVPWTGGLDWGALLVGVAFIFGALFMLGIIGLIVFLPTGSLPLAFAGAFGGSLCWSLFSLYVQLVCFFEPGWYWGWYR